jgi:hypothetical protein
VRLEPLTGDRPPFDDHAEILSLAAPSVSAETVLDLARRLGLAGSTENGMLCADATQLTYKEGSVQLACHRASGGLRYRDVARWQVDDGTADVQLDDDAATELAQGVVARFGLAAPEDCRVLRIARLNAGVMDRSTGYSEVRAIDVGVAFQRLVDDVPVEGAGGKVVVYLDERGALTGFDLLWRDIRPGSAERVELRSLDSAQEALAAEWDGDGSGVVRVDDVRFGYLESGWDEVQGYLQPVYVFPLTILSTEGRSAGRVMMRSEYIVAASVDPPEPPFRRRPAARRQSPRRA